MVRAESLKTSFPSFGASPRNVTALKSVQLRKAEPSMLVTPFPIVILVRLSEKLKALLPILVRLSGIVMLVRLLHSAKVPSSMLVTPFPIVMLVRLVQT